MLKLCGKLCENNLTTEELLPWMMISKTSVRDIYNVLEIMRKGFGLSSIDEAYFQLSSINVNLEESVKIFDRRNGDIYGILLFAETPLHNGSPLIKMSKNISLLLSEYSQVNGFAFIIDERLRGAHVDKPMLLYNEDYLNKFDFIWCAVEKSLKSHSYWKRIGFYEIMEIDDAKFYLKLLNKTLLMDIYYKVHNIISNEKDNN